MPEAIASAIPGNDQGLWTIIMGAGWVVKGVMLVLLLFSVICWGIILTKAIALSRARKDTQLFFDAFRESRKFSLLYAEAKQFTFSPLAHVFKAGYAELNRISRIQQANQPSSESAQEPEYERTAMDNITRSLQQAVIAQRTRLEKGVNFLATTGSSAPFIGLFGTVWGIMESFRRIGVMKSASLAVVAPGIAEALIATAAGLAAAIPAVIFYNYFLSRINIISNEMDNFSSELINIIERIYWKRK
ncbi:MAG: protein TolQ [Desulfomonile tiedjei]|uniref:Protein TolQ n=1 Tax=Desulfomonile tiedjei TaxID=2358 RepID=A0A9D6YZ61_9BACT|nr:protein TolQ [Desulfomonile tiedjei]